MIIESMIAGVTIIFISSLSFANSQIKKQKQWDVDEINRQRQWEVDEDNRLRQQEIDDAERLRLQQIEANKKPEPEPVLDPFLEIKTGTPCPKCTRAAKNKVTNIDSRGWIRSVIEAEGPGVPIICRDPKCKAHKTMHLHGNCYTCGANWFMETADRTKDRLVKEKETCPQDTLHS